jgi:hypothetical protein
VISESIAHLTAQNGERFQVLNDAGDDWDEAATRAQYEAAWLALHPDGGPAP